MDIPVTVNEYSVSVSVVDESVSVAVTVNTISIDVSVNYGLSSTQVNAAIDAKIAEIDIPTKTSELENDSHFITENDIPAIPSKTSELENDSGFIDESALTKENIDGLTELDSPEFADTQITPLATEATYTPAVWSYLVGLFTTVPKSVLQHIVKIWTVMQNLAARIYVLENKTLFEITLPEDVTSMDITGLSIKDGETFNFLIESGAGYEAVSMCLRVNDIASNNYHYATYTIYNYNLIVTGNDRYINILTMTLHGGNLIGSVTYARSHLGTLTGGVVQESTFGLSIHEINKISIIRNGTGIIKAGTKIKLIKG